MLENLKPPAGRINSCRCKALAEELEPDDAQRLWDYLGDADTWSAYGLSNALRSVDLKLSVNSILRHRKGHCSC